jgi:hypothetical protein
MMRFRLRWLLAFAMLIVVTPLAYLATPATPASAAPQAAQKAPAAPADAHQVVHIYQCELGEGATEEMLEAAVQEWLKALRTLDGGEGITIQILWPVAVQMGDRDFTTVVSWPSFTAWGRSQDAYTDDSAAAKWEDLQGGKWNCPDSALWEGVAIQPSK